MIVVIILSSASESYKNAVSIIGVHSLLSKLQVDATGNVRATGYFVRGVIFPLLQPVHRPRGVLVA